MAANVQDILAQEDYKERYGFTTKVEYYEFPKGLSEEVVRKISAMKNEPQWMLDKRLLGYKVFRQKPLPNWGADLSSIDFEDIYYYRMAKAKESRRWEDVPEEVKKTFEKLGVPEAERKFFAGAEAQFDSGVVYSKVNEDLEKLGVIFIDTDTAVKKYPELVKKYFGTVIPPTDNKFAALNSAVWSGGSFIYVPKGVKVPIPLNAYFRINAERSGQFERTLIIADEGAEVTYLEGCTASVYSANSLHAAVVEIVAHKDAHVRYVTIQNWAKNVFNLVTQRAYADENAHVEWIDANIGCLVKGTKIFTNNNVKNIEDIEVGENVYSLNQQFEITSQKVVAKKENPPMDTYRLTTANYRELDATDNHPVLTMHKEGRLTFVGWRQMKDIKVGDLVAVVGDLPDRGKPYKIESIRRIKNVRKRITIPLESNDNLMWLLGFYLRDGYMERARVIFAVPESDQSNKKVKELIKNLFGLESRQYKVSVRVSSAELTELIRELGFTGNAKTKRVPGWVFALPKSQKQAFIEGYFSADGSVKKGHKNRSITSASKELLEQIKFLAISCGLNATKISKLTRAEKKPLGKEEKEYSHYNLYFWEKEMNMPLYFVPVAKKEYLGKNITYDIEVEGTQNFVANGIFVHNSKINMKYPSVYLRGRNSKGEILSIALAGEGQVQDSGGKVYHLAPNTTSRMVSKSISKGSGLTTFRGLVYVSKDAENSKVNTTCDALLLDEQAKTNTYPYVDIQRNDAMVSHEAKVGKISEDEVFYLMSRGIPESDAIAMIILGFLNDLTKVLPMEYSLELKRLIKLDMAGSVG